MNTKIIQNEDILRGTWSGGTFTQYYSIPARADMQADDFIFAISSATVDLEESTFTYYGGCDRVIMSLEKDYVLIHDDTDVCPLHPFEPHSFTGEEKTCSKGTYRDFNLIMKRDHCSGTMSSLQLAPGSAFYGQVGKESEHRSLVTLFCCTGNFVLCSGDEKTAVGAGEMIVLEGAPGPASWKCENSGSENCAIAVCQVELF